jgi:hypothetical protein
LRFRNWTGTVSAGPKFTMSIAPGHISWGMPLRPAASSQ